MATVFPFERTLTRPDHARLVRLADRARRGTPADALQDLLEACDLVADDQVPETLVTLGATVLVQDTARDAPPYELTPCHPEDARPGDGCISVLSPVGAALLGLQVGMTARWRLPGGHDGAARILAVLFQPERAREVAS